jgi:predicted metal-dependent hydrolase
MLTCDNAVHRVWRKNSCRKLRAVGGTVRPVGYRRLVSAAEHARPQWDVEVRRSARRRRTVQAYLRDRTVVVLVPARISKAEEKFWVAEMVGRLERQEDRKRRRRDRGDGELMARARELSRRYLGGRAEPVEVRWVENQNDRWGSCTPARGTIRLSHRLRTMPVWVSDYVLVHELAHLLEDGHGPAFWRLVANYPRMERARGYLEGVAAAAGTSCFDQDRRGLGRARRRPRPARRRPRRVPARAARGHL